MRVDKALPNASRRLASVVSGDKLPINSSFVGLPGAGCLGVKASFFRAYARLMTRPSISLSDSDIPFKAAVDSLIDLNSTYANLKRRVSQYSFSEYTCMKHTSTRGTHFQSFSTCMTGCNCQSFYV